MVALQNVGCFLDHITELQKWRFLCSQVLEKGAETVGALFKQLLF